MPRGGSPRRVKGEKTSGSRQAAGEEVPQPSGRPLRVAVLASLLARRLEHVRGIKAIPQPPIALRPPYLVEKRLQLRVEVGCVGLRSEPHHSSPTSKTRTQPLGNYHYWTVLEFHF